MERFRKEEIHKELVEKVFKGNGTDAKGNINNQALHCAYYVPLKGNLGLDWGVVVNPESPKFGNLVFEHDNCGCPNHQMDDPDPQADEGYIDNWLLPGERLLP